MLAPTKVFGQSAYALSGSLTRLTFLSCVAFYLWRLLSEVVTAEIIRTKIVRIEVIRQRLTVFFFLLDTIHRQRIVNISVNALAVDPEIHILQHSSYLFSAWEGNRSLRYFYYKS